jgi:gas vesicle protein
MNYRWSEGGSGSADWLVNAVTKNPEGLLLLAAGAALLLRSSSRTGQRSSEWTQRDGSRTERWQMPEGASQMADTARDYASQVGQKVSQVSQTVGETADRYVSAAGEYADQARRKVMYQSGQLADQAQSTIERVVREQPLAVAIAGLAAGAAVAAAFPMTRMEQEALGPAGQKLSEAASSAGEKLSSAASAASERLMSAAEERGLSAGGLKEVARDVAGTFEKSMSGDDKDKSGERGSTKQEGAGQHASTAAGGRSSTAKDRPGNR